MATKVERTTRNTRSDILNEGKSARSYVGPLSDASNKSSDSSIPSSLIIEETIRVPSKPVSMFNTGIKPRLSPKPFTRENPPENRSTVGISALSADITSQSNMPFHTSTSISLSGSTKTEDHERVGRRIFTSSYQPDTEEDQLNKLDVFSSILSRKQTSSSWRPTDTGESKSTSQVNEHKVTSKPPLMSRKLDVLQQQEKVHASSLRRPSTDDTDEQKETPEKAKNNSFHSESMDSLTVRAQLRPKRRPVSAMFLDSVSGQTSDSKVTDSQRSWNRRPLSGDLTSLFESGGLGNKKESSFEETKENRPLRRDSLNSRTTEDQSDLVSKVKDFSSSKSASNETRTERNRINQDSTTLPNYTDGSGSGVNYTDKRSIAPGTIKTRISHYLAGNSSSLDSTDSPTNKDKPTPTAEREIRAIVPDKDMEFGRPHAASPYQTADVAKKFLTSSSNVEPRSEKTDEEKSALTLQDIGFQKEKNDWRPSKISEDKRQEPWRSFKKEEPLQLHDNEDVFNESEKHVYKDKQYDNTKEEAEDKYKKLVNVDNPFRTVKATMFEHNVEWHSPAELLSTRNPTSSQPARSDILPESTEGKKDTESWSKWLSDDRVHSVTQLHKESDILDKRVSNSKDVKASSPADHDHLQNFKVDERRRIEPRFEVIQAVGVRVLSESIQMAPEDKAVTLLSRRSFHRKGRELENSEMDESVLHRPVSSLQRSKSEYRRRDTSSQESSTNKYMSGDLDLPFSRKNSLRAAKSNLTKAPADRTYETGKKKSTVDISASDFQPMSYKLDYKQEKENALGKCSTEQSLFGISATHGKDVKISLNDFNRHAHGSIMDSVEKGLETGTRSVKDEPAVSISNIREDMKKPSRGEEINKHSYKWNTFLSDKDSPATKKVNKDESNYSISEMLNNEVEQFKKDLAVTHTTKDTDSFLRGKQINEEYTEPFKYERKKAPFHDRNISSSGTGNLSDLYNFENEETKQKQNVPTISPTVSKATYFAVTGLDNKKEKNDSNFESKSSAASSWTSEEYYTRDVRLSTTISRSDSSSNKPEAINTQGDLGCSSAFKELKTHRNQKVLEDDSVSKSAKTLEKKSVIDIDAFIKRQRQKTSLDDKVSSSRDAKSENKIFSTDLNTAQASPVKLDGSYKSKVVDIDSLMAEYSLNQPKERISRDEDHNVSKSERSKSFRENVSKGSGSKWRDPSERHIRTDESYQFESASSWYSFQTTSTDTKPNSPKISSTADLMKSLTVGKYDQYREKEESPNTSLDSSQESTNLETHKSRSARTSESPTVITDWSTSRTFAKTSVVEMNVDDDSKEDPAANPAVNLHHRISVKTDKKSILTEERQSPSEGRRPAKASDLIALMLENKEKRMEHHRARQSIPVEHQYESRTPRLKSQQEWYHSESKDSSEKESRRQHARPRREPEIGMDPSRRKSLNRHKEWDLRSEEDHVKQCFSRSSTSNKDTDSLVQDPDRQYGTWSQDKQQTEDSCVTDSPSYDNSSRKQHSHSRLSSLSHTETDQHDSINEARDGSLDRCSMDLDSTEGTESTPSEAKSVDFSFIDQTSVLDSTALKNRVQLSRKSQRRAPSQLQRRSRLLQSSSQLAVIEDTDNLWTYTDSTEEKPEKKEEVEEEEEKPQRTSVHSPRMPMFPGMDPSTLMAQLRKRQDAESSSESSPQVTKSPKSPLPHGTLGIKLLPTPADKQDKAAGESPQWLKELKSKKRQSQYENNS